MRAQLYSREVWCITDRFVRLLTPKCKIAHIRTMRHAIVEWMGYAEVMLVYNEIGPTAEFWFRQSPPVDPGYRQSKRNVSESDRDQHVA